MVNLFLSETKLRLLLAALHEYLQKYLYLSAHEKSELWARRYEDIAERVGELLDDVRKQRYR